MFSFRFNSKLAFSLFTLGLVIAGSTLTLASLEPNKLSFDSIRLSQARQHLNELRIKPEPVIVAVIDTGLAPFHPAFMGKIITNENEPIQIDPDGHGTHVAGLIVQVNPQAKILGVRVLDRNGFGSSDDVVQAIKYSVDKGAKVINLSLGAADLLGRTEPDYERAIRYAREKDVLVLSAAGNDYGSNNDIAAVFPANTWEDNAMAICSNSLNGRLSSFSNYGQFRVHLCAPGEGLLSANSKYNPTGGNNAFYATMSGTSQATPLVSGVASIIYGLNPKLKAYQVRDILMETTSTSFYLKGASQTGGVLNAEVAIKKALDVQAVLN